MRDYENPYQNPQWRGWVLHPHHGGAQTLQDLLLHLYNSSAWPVAMNRVCCLDHEHWSAAMAFLHDYRARGEDNEVFLQLCREVIATRVPQESNQDS